VPTKRSYDQAEKLSRECENSDSQKKHQPGINTQVVVETRVVLWVSVEVTAAQKVDQISQHPQQCRQSDPQQILQPNNNDIAIYHDPQKRVATNNAGICTLCTICHMQY